MMADDEKSWRDGAKHVLDDVFADVFVKQPNKLYRVKKVRHTRIVCMQSHW
jgi:hypothetical protein